MNAFLTALKSKASEVQAKIETPKITPLAKVIADHVQPLNNYYANSAGQSVINDYASNNVITLSAEPPKMIVTVERVINRHRLDLFFSVKPNDQILESLRSHGWHYRPSDRAWYHQDNETNRIYCESNFGAYFEPDTADSVQHTAVSEAPIDTVTLTSERNESKDQVFEPEYLRFRTQTDELIEHLKIAPADLMLMAIDSLHKKLFSRDS